MTISWSRARSAKARAARRTLPRWTSAVIGSPRLRRALPPSATTTRMSASYRREQDRLDGVHAVFRLVEDDGSLGFENLLRHLHAVDAVLLVNLLADFGLAIVEGRQAVHELGVGVVGGRHDLRGHAIGSEQLDALFPHRVRLAHGDPDVGIDEVAVPRRLLRIFRERDPGAGLLGNLPALLDQLLLGPAGPRGAQADIHPDERRSGQEGIAHVVAGIAQKAELDLREMLAHELPH